MCGEKKLLLSPSRYFKGSPPRVRGKANAETFPIYCPGITPACAGKRSTLLCAPPRSRDHPRACGEKQMALFKIFLRWGSPPRVRGKEAEKQQALHRPRITPACAGKSRCRSCRDTSFRDHPRVCGEKQRDDGRRSDRRGSPPRVRGKGAYSLAGAFIIGITPACAGKRLKKALKNKDF